MLRRSNAGIISPEIMNEIETVFFEPCNRTNMKRPLRRTLQRSYLIAAFKQQSKIKLTAEYLYRHTHEWHRRSYAAMLRGFHQRF